MSKVVNDVVIGWGIVYFWDLKMYLSIGINNE